MDTLVVVPRLTPAPRDSGSVGREVAMIEIRKKNRPNFIAALACSNDITAARLLVKQGWKCCAFIWNGNSPRPVVAQGLMESQGSLPLALTLRPPGKLWLYLDAPTPAQTHAYRSYCFLPPSRGCGVL